MPDPVAVHEHAVLQGAFARHLGAALAAVSDEVPSLYGKLVAAIGDREVALRVGDEAFAVHRRGERLELAPERAPAVRLVTTGATILALADGELTLEDAIWSGRLDLTGSVDALLAFHDALLVYLHAAVRSPSSPRRLGTFRARFSPGAPMPAASREAVP